MVQRTLGGIYGIQLRWMNENLPMTRLRLALWYNGSPHPRWMSLYSLRGSLYNGGWNIHQENITFLKLYVHNPKLFELNMSTYLALEVLT